MLDFLKDKVTFEDHPILVSDHLEKYFADATISVFHEVVTLGLHVDVYFVQPKDTGYNLLVTGGMSLLAMDVDPRAPDPRDLRFAEVMILIPKNIAFGTVVGGNEGNNWVVSMLKQIARFPHYYNTWLGVGHTIQAEEEIDRTYGPDTKFVGAVILPSMTLPPAFTALRHRNDVINFYSVFPVYQDELAFKIENGFGAFADLLRKANAREVLDLNRRSLLKARSFWSFFKT